MATQLEDSLRRPSDQGFLRLSQYGGYTVEFERAYDRPIKEVWSTMTDPHRMVDWYADADVEPREGGKITLRFANSGAICYGIITEYNPPNVFEHVWVTGKQAEPVQPMPQSLADRGYTCGDINTCGSVLRFQLTEQEGGGTFLAVSHYIPMNPHLIPGSLAKSKNPRVSEVPAPDMVLASWECLLYLLDKALRKPGNRAMSLAAERTEEWPWDKHSELRQKYANVVGSHDAIEEARKSIGR